MPTRAGDDSDLHILIFDEIDAICPARFVRTSRDGKLTALPVGY
jgi:hypothetical protein